MYGLFTCKYARGENPGSISSIYNSTSCSSDEFAPFWCDHPRPSMAAAAGKLDGDAVVGGESGSFQWARSCYQNGQLVTELVLITSTYCLHKDCFCITIFFGHIILKEV